MVKRKKGRELNGIVLLDKPLGLSSNKALQQVKILFDAQKAGHTGSLDPQASGLLPICFGEATKFSRFLLDADKVYIATIQFGKTTSTADSEGDITSETPVEFAFEVLVEVLSGFLGQQTQIPSMYSALKHNGQPLYKLARKGKEIERKVRDIFIHELDVLSDRALFTDQQRIELRVKCSKGTYIRNLAEDIGAKAGCGAYLHSLRRIQTGNFSDMHTHKALEQEKALHGLEGLNRYILPVDQVLMAFPECILDEKQSLALKHGREVLLTADGHESGMCRIYCERHGFLGLGEIGHNRLRGKRLLRTN